MLLPPGKRRRRAQLQFVAHSMFCGLKGRCRLLDLHQSGQFLSSSTHNKTLLAIAEALRAFTRKTREAGLLTHHGQACAGLFANPEAGS